MTKLYLLRWLCLFKSSFLYSYGMQNMEKINNLYSESFSYDAKQIKTVDIDLLFMKHIFKNDFSLIFKKHTIKFLILCGILYWLSYFFLGLSLVFAILRQNWQQSQQNPGSSILCNEVLKTALRVLSSLPMMSLANTTSNDIGQSTLNQVNEFLMSSMNPYNIGGDEGKSTGW